MRMPFTLGYVVVHVICVILISERLLGSITPFRDNVLVLFSAQKALGDSFALFQFGQDYCDVAVCGGLVRRGQNVYRHFTHTQTKMLNMFCTEKTGSDTFRTDCLIFS